MRDDLYSKFDASLKEFNREEFERYLSEAIFTGLKEKNKAIIDKGGLLKLDTAVQARVGLQFGDAVARTTARDIYSAAQFFMGLQYAAQRARDGKSSCEALNNAQANFVDFAYDMATGFCADDADEILCASAMKLKDAFDNFKAYVGDDAEAYALFLAQSTHDALKKIHPNCNGLDENLLAITKKYTP